MNKFTFIIHSEPKGKERPRGNRGKYYTPKNTVIYENLVKLEFISQGGFVINGAILLEIESYIQIPKSYKGNKRDKCIKNEYYPTKKPDFDNCIKAISDALNGLAYNDDAYITDCIYKKRWTVKNSYTKVIIKKIGESFQ